MSRPSSPAAAIVATSRMPMLTRGRVASIRRESDCSTENEAAHEKLIKTSQQVSLGFEDFCLVLVFKIYSTIINNYLLFKY